MKLETIHVENVHWRVSQHIDLIRPVLVISGPNESGKTTLLRAVADLSSERLFGRDSDWSLHVAFDDLEARRWTGARGGNMVVTAKDGGASGVRAGCKRVAEVLNRSGLFDLQSFLARSAKAQREQLREILDAVQATATGEGEDEALALDPRDKARILGAGMAVPTDRYSAQALVASLGEAHRSADSRARSLLGAIRGAQEAVDRVPDEVRRVNLPSIDAEIEELEERRQALRDELTRGDERLKVYRQSVHRVEELSARLQSVVEEIPKAKVAAKAAEAEAEAALAALAHQRAGWDVTRQAREAAETDVRDAAHAASEARVLAESLERENALMGEHALLLVEAADALEEAEWRLDLADRLRGLADRIGGTLLGRVREQVRDAVAAHQHAQRALHEAQRVEALALAAGRDARDQSDLRTRASNAANVRLITTEHRAETLKRELDEAKAAETVEEPPPIEPIRLQLSALEALLAERRKVRTQANDAVQATATLRRQTSERDDAVTKRDRYRDALASAESVLAEFLEADTRALIGPASEIVERVTGYRIALDMSGGSDEPLSLVRGDHTVPLSQASDSQTVIAGVALAAVAARRAFGFRGWRAIIVDRFESVGQDRRTALLDALGEEIAKGHLDNVIVACVEDGWVYPNGHHHWMAQ